MEDIKLINLTPHDVNILNMDGELKIKIETDGVARCSITRFREMSIKMDDREIRVNKTKFGNVDGLPDPQDNTWYIVSKPVAEALKHKRADLLIADQVMRDNGRIIGCRALAIIT